jgi:CPA2 family monovalent cation:H+ antiporter-2
LTIFSILIVAIILLSSRYILPLIADLRFGHSIAALITLIAVAPFLWALSFRPFAVNELSILIEERKYRGPIALMFLFRLILAVFLIGFLLKLFFSTRLTLIVLVIAIGVYFIFRKRLNAQYHRIESHFLKNLHGREIAKFKTTRSDLSPWDEHMAFFDIAKSSNIAGKTLEELQIREQLGINIASIKRGEIVIHIPNKTERLFPGDEICVIGTDTQLKEFKTYLDLNEINPREAFKEPDIVLRQIELKNEAYIGKSIKESRLREKTSGLVVGIEKKGRRILNPESNVILEKEDILWIVGDKKLLSDLVRK